MNHPIYMDYAATTPIDGRVAKLMSRYMDIEGVLVTRRRGLMSLAGRRKKQLKMRVFRWLKYLMLIRGR